MPLANSQNGVLHLSSPPGEVLAKMPGVRSCGSACNVESTSCFHSLLLRFSLLFPHSSWTTNNVSHVFIGSIWVFLADKEVAPLCFLFICIYAGLCEMQFQGTRRAKSPQYFNRWLNNGTWEVLTVLSNCSLYEAVTLVIKVWCVLCRIIYLTALEFHIGLVIL